MTSASYSRVLRGESDWGGEGSGGFEIGMERERGGKDREGGRDRQTGKERKGKDREGVRDRQGKRGERQRGSARGKTERE